MSEHTTDPHTTRTAPLDDLPPFAAMVAPTDPQFTSGVTLTPPPAASRGWVCPRCERGVAPAVQVCPCGPAVAAAPFPYVYPVGPQPWWLAPTWTPPLITYTISNVS